MRAPYQIKRFAMDGQECKFCFVLIDTRTNRMVANGYGNSSVAPKGLRNLQAKLNTKAVLDC